MATHRIVQSYRNAGGLMIDSSLAVLGDVEVNADLVLPAESVNVDLVVALDVSALQSLCFACTGDCTIKTNSTGAPTNTIVLTAGEARICRTPAECAALLTGDVTVLYLSSTAGGTFKVMSLMDGTP